MRALIDLLTALEFFFNKLDEIDGNANIGMEALLHENKKFQYRSGTVNSKSFVGKVLLRIKQKFELTYAL